MAVTIIQSIDEIIETATYFELKDFQIKIENAIKRKMEKMEKARLDGIKK